MDSETHIVLRERVGFDPMTWLDEEALNRELQEIARNPVMGAVLDAANSELFVVNRQLQIVAANSRVMERESASRHRPLVGQRIGETRHCTNAVAAAYGCATSGECAFCGALNTILESREQGASVVGECLMICDLEGEQMAAELSVTATPITIGKTAFTVVSLLDIADRKRREVLERLFVHDIKNSLQGILGWSELLAENPHGNTEKLATRISALTRSLAEEIETQRLLVAAESDELTPNIQEVSPSEFISRLKALFTHHQFAYSKSIYADLPTPDSPIRTDSSVLRRVLVNMVTNALEATKTDGAIRIGGAGYNGGFRFYVWNPGVVSAEVAANIFKRSFSTKSSQGRGLGTYSMKLFGEQVLGGKVYFSSEEEGGTTFYLELPDAPTG